MVVALANAEESVCVKLAVLRTFSWCMQVPVPSRMAVLIAQAPVSARELKALKQE
jgi:hypothetical protein